MLIRLGIDMDNRIRYNTDDPDFGIANIIRRIYMRINFIKE